MSGSGARNELELSQNMIDFNEDKQQKRLEELHLKEAEELAQILSKRYSLPYIDLSQSPINTDALRLVPEDLARQAQVAAFKLVGRTIHLAVMSPNNDKYLYVLDDLKNKNYDVVSYLTSETSLARAWQRYAEAGVMSETYAGAIKISEEAIAAKMKAETSLAAIRDLIAADVTATLDGSSVSTLLETVLSGALASDASDIHFEPEESQVRLRYRLDGVLQDLADIPTKVYNPIVSRIKLVSGLKLNLKQSAQDGRFTIHALEEEIEIRTSVIPGAYGESIVLRVLNPKSIRVTFETLGVEPELLKHFDREINRPNGIVLLTGPTGSGKTTTLYSFLRRINSPENKIITIEDPIEYHLQGINQTQVNIKEDYTFANGLRSALRQDPDVIMVGEIRDSETAEIAINSALTGHLVFSTLHTNNAAGTIPRLIDLGVNPKVISSALNIAIAQRLARKLCDKCKVEVVPSPADQKFLSEILASVGKKRPELVLPSVTKFWQAKGCEACNNSGFKGRVGIFEAIKMDEKIAQVAIENPSEREIKIAAQSQGILDMRQDGVLKVLSGVTTLDELARVIDLSEEVLWSFDNQEHKPLSNPFNTKYWS